MSKYILRTVFVGLLAVASFTAVGLILAMAGSFHPLPLLLGGLALSFILAWVSDWGRSVVLPPIPTSAIVVVVILVAVFAAMSAKYSAEHLLTDRDPGVYLTTGKWLANHDSIFIEGKVGGFSGVDGVSARSPGYYDTRSDGLLYAQFQHGLPVWIAVSQWFGGDWLMFKTNALVGAGALIVFFLLAATLLRPWFGVLATAALAGNLVLLHFSRDTYSEPLALLFMFGGLWALIISRDHPKSGFSFASGFVFGAAAMVRIDVWMSVVLLFIYFVLVVVGARDRSDRSLWMSYVLPAGLGVLIAASIGFVDLVVASPQYLSDLSSKVRLIFLLVLAVIASGILIVGLWRFFAPVVHRLRPYRRLLADTVATGIVGLALILYFVRPEMQVVRSADEVGYVGAIQAFQGLDPDPFRTYAEWSLRWLGWYMGVVPLFMAVVGLAGVARATIMGSARRWAAPLIIIGGTALLYLWKPAISPDHLWAMRRYLPMVLPGMVLAAAWLVQQFADFRSADRRVEVPTRVLAIGGAALMTVLPVLFAAPLMASTTQVGLYGATVELCSSLPKNAAVLIVDDYLALLYQGAIRGFCDVPVARSPLDQETIESVDAAWVSEGRRLFIVGGPNLLGDSSLEPTFRVSFLYTLPERTLMRRPDRLIEEPFGFTLVPADELLGHMTQTSS